MPVTRRGRRRQTYRQYAVNRRANRNDEATYDEETVDNWQSLDNPVYLNLRREFIQKLNSINMLICENCKEKTLVNYNPVQMLCLSCRVHRPIKFTADNNMDPGPVPDELKDLTHVEQLLIAQVNPVMMIFRLPRGGQYGFKGHVLNIPQNISQFITNLPRTVDQLDILVLRKANTNAELPEKFFTVRRGRILAALTWLKRNNVFYQNITISEENLNCLPANGLLELSVDHYQNDTAAETNDAHAATSTAVNVESDIPQSYVPIHMPRQTEHATIQAALANDQVLQWPTLEDEPVNEFNSVGYLSRAFPCLFPTGAADIRAARQLRVTQTEYFKHLLKYFDGRFESNPRFLFLAFNSCLRWQSLQIGKVFVRNNPNDAPLSVQDLQALAQRDQVSFASRILRFGSSLRGTSQYWYSQKANLLAMTKQLGRASIFFTFSMADMQWPELEQFLDPMCDNRAQAIANAPHTTDAYVSLRFELFFKTFLIPYLDVQDYWYRYEWQSRGSLHVHGLAWIIEKPDTRVCSESDISRFTDKYISAWNTSIGPNDDPSNFFRHIEVHPCSISPQDVQNLDEDLKQLINTCQRHTRCSPAYCLRENAEGQQQCRFNFPKPLQAETTVDFTLNERNERQKLVVKPARNDPFLNTYNSHCLSVHRANMDMNIVLDLTDVANYIAKYTSKAEQASHNYFGIFQNIISQELPREAPFQRSVNALLMKTIGNLDVSAQQAVHICSGRPLLHSSREFVPCYVNGYSLDDELHATQPSDIRKYMNRPAHLENMSLLQVLRQYKMRAAAANNTIICTARAKEAVVRIMPHLSSSPNSERYSQYCMQFLVLNKPFRQWQDLTAGFANAEVAYREFRNAFPTGDNDEELTQAVERAVNEIHNEPDNPPEPERIQDPWMAVVQPDYTQPDPELQAAIQTPTYNWALDSERFQHLIRPAITFIQEAKAQPALNLQRQPHVNSDNLNEEQRQVFDYVLDADTPKPLHVMVLGSAGTGKSFLIHCLKQQLGNSCIVLAPTGVAALNIGGETVHSFFMFAKVSQVAPLQQESLQMLQDRCKNIKFVIIDELSMIGCKLFNVIDLRMRQAFPQQSDAFFGGCSVIMFGDLGQLPPVGDTRLFQPNQRSQPAIQGHAAYRCFNKVFFLTASVRQAEDEQFKEALLRMRGGAPTQNDYQLFSSRFSGVAEETSFQAAIRLFPTTAEVQAFNKHKLLSLGAPVANIESVNSSPQAVALTSNHFSGLERYCSIANGAKIMLRTNLWTQGGLVNGSVGKVLHIVYAENQQPPSLPAVVICQFPSYTGPPFLEAVPQSVPIVPISRKCTATDNSVIQRTGLPLSLSWALTIHKCQGLTLENAVVSLGERDISSGISFVALSRVRRSADLLINPFPYDRIKNLYQNTQIQQRINEEERLRNFA